MTGLELIAEFAAKGINVSSDVLAQITLNPTAQYVYNYGAPYGAQFYNIMVPVVVILSAIYTAMAVAAIAEKDKLILELQAKLSKLEQHN